MTTGTDLHHLPHRLPPSSLERGLGRASSAVSGNRCPRGAAYAREELLAPRRTVTATCRGRSAPARGRPRGPRGFPAGPAPFPKERVDELLAAIYALEEPCPSRGAESSSATPSGLGIDVVATRTLA